MTKIDARKAAVRVATLIANCPDSHSEIAAKLGVDKSLVTRWRSGTRKPTDVQLDRLEELYGAPATPPAPPAPPPPASSRPDADEAQGDDDDEAQDLDAAELVDEHPDEDNHARLRRYIREGIRGLQSDRELSGVKRAEALKKLCDAQVALDRSTGENAVTMRKIVAHPEFLRVVRMITEAIAPYPEALSAAIAVLEGRS